MQSDPYYTARVHGLSDIKEASPELEAMQAHMVNLFAKFVSMIPYLPDELQVVATNIKDAGKVTDLIAANLNVSLDEKQELLTQLDVRKRIERLTSILNREIELLDLGQKIQTQVQDELTKNQKDFYLRQQVRAIQRSSAKATRATTRSRSCARSSTPPIRRKRCARSPTTRARAPA
ncbi:MAG: LON peptidase substrate-binding domain-containing protein [Candidatus Binatia bacterium]